MDDAFPGVFPQEQQILDYGQGLLQQGMAYGFRFLVERMGSFYTKTTVFYGPRGGLMILRAIAIRSDNLLSWGYEASLSLHSETVFLYFSTSGFGGTPWSYGWFDVDGMSIPSEQSMVYTWWGMNDVRRQGSRS